MQDRATIKRTADRGQPRDPLALAAEEVDLRHPHMRHEILIDEKFQPADLRAPLALQDIVRPRLDPRHDPGGRRQHPFGQAEKKDKPADEDHKRQPDGPDMDALVDRLAPDRLARIPFFVHRRYDRPARARAFCLGFPLNFRHSD